MCVCVYTILNIYLHTQLMDRYLKFDRQEIWRSSAIVSTCLQFLALQQIPQVPLPVRAIFCASPRVLLPCIGMYQSLPYVCRIGLFCIFSSLCSSLIADRHFISVHSCLVNQFVPLFQSIADMNLVIGP